MEKVDRKYTAEMVTDLSVPLIYDPGDLDLLPPHRQNNFLQQLKKNISELQRWDSTDDP